MNPKLILCDCLGSQKLDPKALEEATGLTCSKVYTNLCGDQAEAAAGEISSGNCIVACGQEYRFFEDLSAEIDSEKPAHIDLRDRAGWTDDKTDTTPKMVALLAEAALDTPPTKAFEIVSEGLCLIIGVGDVAFNAAAQLADTLGVTVLQLDDCEPPLTRDFDVIRGSIRNVKGVLGGFDVRFDRLSQMIPGGRGAWDWSNPRKDGRSSCDIILDLSGGNTLFPAPEKREGYLRSDPGSLTAVAENVLKASQLVGTFEKPLYVRLEPQLCAHSRAEQPGCTKCLDACPTGAITSSGEHVSVDPMICAGCGACSALCPSGAISYDAPPVASQMERIQKLATAYHSAGGVSPRLLVTEEYGYELVQLSARFGKGLPANVIPMQSDAIAGFGHAEILAALAAGFADVTILPSPNSDRNVIVHECALANGIAKDGVTLLDVSDPDELDNFLDRGPRRSSVSQPIRPMGTRRQIARQAAKALNPETEILPLPQGAPYGGVLVNTESCTLCLSCVALCPSGALGDNPDLPQLRFQEDACLQCGLCSNICPEDAITYEPRLNLNDSALSQEVLNEEEPFACIECGSLFGSKSTIERITEKLSDHSMFQRPEALKMIQMCDDCRVNAQFHSDDNPFAGGERPRVRTTEDYLSKRRDH